MYHWRLLSVFWLLGCVGFCLANEAGTVPQKLVEAEKSNAGTASETALGAEQVTLPVADSVECEILVVGGGAAGTAAALLAGEAGAKTILLEATQQLGGTTTSGGVAFPGLFHAWGRQIIDGPIWRVITKTVELDGGTLPDFSVPTGPDHWRHQIRLNGALYALMLEEAIRKAGVELRYYEAPVQMAKLSGTCGGWLVTTAAMGKIRQIQAAQVIDCTGNGAVAALAGGKRLREDVTQPGTFNYQLETGLDVNSLSTEQKATIEARYNEALKNGTLQPGDASRGIWPFLQNSESNYVYGADSSTAETRAKTNQRGRESALRMLRFVRSLPGGENARLKSASPEVGVRETWRVLGEYLITEDDYVNGRVWPDSLCYAFYPVDLHRNATGVQPAHLAEGIVPTVPLRALIPQGLENLLVAGRCISSDRMANSGLRVQATCMATGQAATAAAIIAVKEKTTPMKADLAKIKALLKKHGAIVPE